MAEYAYNDILPTTMAMSQSFAKFGFDSKSNLQIEPEANILASRKDIDWMPSVHAMSYKDLELTWETIWKYHDWYQKEPTKNVVSDLVMLNGKNLKMKIPSRIQNAQLHGPIKVSKVLLPTDIKLEPPSRWCIHNSFTASLIDTYQLATNPVSVTPELA
jgi:hypothetical protein